MTGPTPIFIFSLPRAGSTLLQRLLAAHPEVASAAEPTFLLPILSGLEGGGAYSIYQHQLAAWAVQDFANGLPGGRADLYSELRELTLRLYQRAAPEGKRYFLDKTPSYAFVVDEILTMFPHAPVVFLWRNPLACAASIIRTFGRGRWVMHLFSIYFYRGLENLVSASLRAGERASTLKYEDLVRAPGETISGLVAALGLSPEPDQLDNYQEVRFPGRFGDPDAGSGSSREIHADSVDRWPGEFSNPLRRAWARRYLRELGPEALSLMGYRKEALLETLAGAPPSGKHLVPDLYRMAYGALYPWFEFRMLRHKLEAVRRGERLYIHI